MPGRASTTAVSTRRMMQLLAACLAGMYTAAWGAYKDAPFERFNRASFWRSLAFSLGIALALHGRLAQLHAVEAFFLVMGLERLAIEIYKPCFRREHPDRARELPDVEAFPRGVLRGAGARRARPAPA